jgi:hypothetical protein
MEDINIEARKKAGSIARAAKLKANSQIKRFQTQIRSIRNANKRLFYMNT